MWAIELTKRIDDEPLFMIYCSISEVHTHTMCTYIYILRKIPNKVRQQCVGRQTIE